METAKHAIEAALEKLHLKPSSESAVALPPPDQVSALRAEYAKYSQEQVFSFWDELSRTEQAKLYKQLSSISPSRINTICSTVFTSSVESSSGEDEISP